VAISSFIQTPKWVSIPVMVSWPLPFSSFPTQYPLRHADWVHCISTPLALMRSDKSIRIVALPHIFVQNLAPSSYNLLLVSSSIIQYPYPPGTWYCVSCACSGVATTPVPMAQTGSWDYVAPTDDQRLHSAPSRLLVYRSFWLIAAQTYGKLG